MRYPKPSQLQESPRPSLNTSEVPARREDWHLTPHIFTCLWGKFIIWPYPLTTRPRRRKLVRHSRGERRSSRKAYVHTRASWYAKGVKWKEAKAKASCCDPTSEDLLSTCPDPWAGRLQRVPAGSSPKGESEVRLLATKLCPTDSFVIPWTVAHQAPFSTGFSWQEYWSGLPFLSLGILLTQGSNLHLLHCRQIFYQLSRQSQPCSLGTENTGSQSVFEKH